MNMCAMSKTILLRKKTKISGEKSKPQQDYSIPGATITQVENISERKTDSPLKRKSQSAITKQSRELHILYALLDLAYSPPQSPDQFFTEIIRIISTLWPEPEKPGIRLVIEGYSYESDNFTERSNPETVEIIISENDIGQVELHYTSEQIQQTGNNELVNTRLLIRAVAREIGRYISHRRMEHAIDTLCHHQLVVLDSIDEPIYIVDPTNFSILWSNRAFNKLWGQTADQKCYKVVCSRNSSCPDCIARQKNSKVKSQTLEILHESSGRWFRCVGRMTQWPDGRQVVCHVAIDITEHKQAREALEASETRFRELFDNMSSGVAIYEGIDGGDNFIFRDFNRAAEQIEGSLKKDMIGRNITDAFPGIVEFGLLEVMRRVWKSGKSEHHPVSLYKDNRIQGWRENYVYKLPSGEIAAIYDDVTKRKKQEEALQIANDRLETKQELLTEKNIALSQILNQIEKEKKQIGRQIRANVDKIIFPIIRKLDEKIGEGEREYLDMLKTNLEEIASPFVNEVEKLYSQLSPREIEICNMIRNGQTSKDIASAFDTSLETVRKQRQNIRRKLKLTKSNTNLASFLQRL